MCFLNLLFMKSVRHIGTQCLGARLVVLFFAAMLSVKAFQETRKELKNSSKWGLSWNKKACNSSNQYDKYYIFVMITTKASFLIHLKKNLLTS